MLFLFVFNKINNLYYLYNFFLYFFITYISLKSEHFYYFYYKIRITVSLLRQDYAKNEDPKTT